MSLFQEPFDFFDILSSNDKDPCGHIGFQFKDGRITSISNDSSAARWKIQTIANYSLATRSNNKLNKQAPSQAPEPTLNQRMILMFKKTNILNSTLSRNGLLINHHLLEVNGQNVVGVKDKVVGVVIEEGGDVITITIIPTYIYNSIMKK